MFLLRNKAYYLRIIPVILFLSWTSGNITGFPGILMFCVNVILKVTLVCFIISLVLMSL